MSEPKKISFGFSKINNKAPVFSSIKPKDEENQIELIDCLEDQSIKIKDAVIKEAKPLIIPLIGTSKNLLDRVREANDLKERSRKKYEVKVEVEDTRPDSELTLDELAARQLILEAKNKAEQANNPTEKVHTLPALEDKLILEGSVEPTLEDYESVPIGDFGMAMLRGMGWSEQTGIGKGDRAKPAPLPELRPKGMGLGADTFINHRKNKVVTIDENGKELKMVKGAYAKIIAGKQKDNYCEVQGLDEESGRVIVKITLSGVTTTLNEFLLELVTRKEYANASRILNNAKYNEYKQQDNGSFKEVEQKTSSISSHSHSKHNRSRSRSRSRSNSRRRHKDKKHKSRSRSRSRSKNRGRRSASSEKDRRKSKKKHKSSHKKHKKSRHRSDSSS